MPGFGRRDTDLDRRVMGVLLPCDRRRCADYAPLPGTSQDDRSSAARWLRQVSDSDPSDLSVEGYLVGCDLSVVKSWDGAGKCGEGARCGNAKVRRFPPWEDHADDLSLSPIDAEFGIGGPRVCERRADGDTKGSRQGRIGLWEG